MIIAATPIWVWYTTRGTALVSLLLLSATVVMGVLQIRRWSSPATPRFVLGALHRNVSLLAVAFVAVHVITSVIDSYAGVGWLRVVVPWGADYRPLWTGLGAVAVDLMVVIVATSLLRTRMGYRTWRALHWSAYACWPVAVAHGLGDGHDTGLVWDTSVYAACGAVVAVAVAWRLWAGRAEPSSLPGRPGLSPPVRPVTASGR